MQKIRVLLLGDSALMAAVEAGLSARPDFTVQRVLIDLAVVTAAAASGLYDMLIIDQDLPGGEVYNLAIHQASKPVLVLDWQSSALTILNSITYPLPDTQGLTSLLQICKTS